MKDKIWYRCLRILPAHKRYLEQKFKGHMSHFVRDFFNEKMKNQEQINLLNIVEFAPKETESLNVGMSKELYDYLSNYNSKLLNFLLITYISEKIAKDNAVVHFEEGTSNTFKTLQQQQQQTAAEPKPQAAEPQQPPQPVVEPPKQELPETPQGPQQEEKREQPVEPIIPEPGIEPDIEPPDPDELAKIEQEIEKYGQQHKN